MLLMQRRKAELLVRAAAQASRASLQRCVQTWRCGADTAFQLHQAQLTEAAEFASAQTLGGMPCLLDSNPAFPDIHILCNRHAIKPSDTALRHKLVHVMSHTCPTCDSMHDQLHAGLHPAQAGAAAQEAMKSQTRWCRSWAGVTRLWYCWERCGGSMSLWRLSELLAFPAI